MATVGGPHVIELAGVPNRLEEEKGHPDGMGRWTSAFHENNASAGINTALEESNMAAVVRAVKIFAIPATKKKTCLFMSLNYSGRKTYAGKKI